ncbi:hypothetical protein LTR67_001214 [Exophiala xenobiotica]
MREESRGMRGNLMSPSTPSPSTTPSTPPIPNLYPGETLSNINNAPCITYFRPGDPSRPLAVFIPGAAHLARIFYGGHTGHSPADFVSHWFPQVGGYNFLAISYPLETDPATMSMSMSMPASTSTSTSSTSNATNSQYHDYRPDMTVREWGAQAVEATRQTIAQHHLQTNNVILCVWSMAGKILQPYVLAARREPSIDIQFAVSLVATPAIRGVREKPALTPSPTGSGYATAAGLSVRYFLTQLHEQNRLNASNKPIIPDDVYQREYLGNFPVGIGCYGVRWSETHQSFVDDPNMGYEVADEMSYSELPFLCSISCHSPVDLRHSIADKYTWGSMSTYKLFGGLSPAARAALQKDSEAGRKVIQLFHSAPERFCTAVEGGHHFFVGERGAKVTAELVLEFEKRLADFQKDLAAIQM